MTGKAPLLGRSLAARLGPETLRRLHSAHGPSFHLFNEARLRTNVADLLAVFRAIYPRVGIGHSYKTNYVPAVARALSAAGAVPEVVSSLEYALALRLGASPGSIIVNGPVKRQDLLEQALVAGSLVNVDGLQEVDRVLAIADAHPDRTLRTGLRVNFALPGLDRSRFGLDATGADLSTAMTGLRSRANITVEGLHCHLGGDRSAASYGMRAEQLITLADMLFPEAPPRWLDIGGGFAGGMPDELRAQFKVPPPRYADYAAAVAPVLAKRYGSGPDAPQLILEPGMGLLSDTFEFVSRVEATKTVDGRHHAIIAGSIYNVKPTLNKFDLPVDVIRHTPSSGGEQNWIVSGATCMEIDILHSGLRTDLSVGDDIVFLNTGAYTVVLQPPFIIPAPAIITVHGDLRTTLARRAEQLDDLMRTYTTTETPA
jgi:diaminopimelate decarboxylase